MVSFYARVKCSMNTSSMEDNLYGISSNSVYNDYIWTWEIVRFKIVLLYKLLLFHIDLL